MMRKIVDKLKRLGVKAEIKNPEMISADYTNTSFPSVSWDVNIHYKNKTVKVPYYSHNINMNQSDEVLNNLFLSLRTYEKYPDKTDWQKAYRLTDEMKDDIVNTRKQIISLMGEELYNDVMGGHD